MLSQAQIESYRTEGYLIVENVFQSDEVGQALCIVDDFVEKSRQVTSQEGHFDLEPGHTAEHPKVRRMSSPVTYHSLFNQWMGDARVLDILTPLIGRAIRAQGNKLNIKPPQVGSPIEWHQDFAHYPHTNDDLCAVGIALDDATEKNGCMMVIPRSHKGPILDHHQEGVFVGAISPQRDDIDLSTAVPLEMKAGSLSVHHARTLHGSALNTSPHWRRLLLYQYAAVDAWPLGGVNDWGAFNDDILCGDPTFDFRLQSMMTRTRLPAGKRTGGGIYELQRPLQEKLFANE